MSDAAGIISLNVNRQLLNERLAKYAHEMSVESSQFVRRQAGLLMRELAEGAAPKSQAVLAGRIDKDVGLVYAPMPKKMLPLTHRQGHGFVWIMASPSVLTGVKDRNYHPDDSVDDLKKLYHRTRDAGIIKGNKYLPLGTHGKKGHQSVQELNRIVVRRGVLNDFKIWLKRRAGILGGSWAIGWNFISPGGRPPAAYKFKHTLDGTARGSFIDGLGIPGKATFTIINRATGVELPSQLKMVSDKLRHRAEAMKADVENMLRGAYTKAGFSKPRK